MYLLKSYMNKEIKYISVTALNRYISYKFEMDDNLKEVYLKGEISNFKYSGRHCYFSIKDQNSEISAMFFYPDNITLKFVPKDGMSIQVVGNIQVYQKRGTYAIIVKKMEQAGIGDLYQQYLELKDKLAKEGLFDENRKLKIPEYPEKVAVITASTGEAINDIISTFNRRLPIAKIRLYPALVQGNDAPRDLIRALGEVYRDKWADVLIIGRGGGSFEDLSCFNDENLVRVLSNSLIPTVSAIGHEGDYTLCDFVASYRAPTPTGAAMRLSKDRNEVSNYIFDKNKRLVNSLKHKLVTSYNEYERYIKSYVLTYFDNYIDKYGQNYRLLNEKLNNYSPIKIVDSWENKLKELTKYLELSSNAMLANYINKFDNISSHLNDDLLLNNINRHEQVVDKLIDKSILLNPFNVMLKGYSIIKQDDNIIKSINDVKLNNEIDIIMQDGTIKAMPVELKEND